MTQFEPMPASRLPDAAPAFTRRTLLGVGASAALGSVVGLPPLASAASTHQSKGSNSMPSITTKDGVEIFYKDWGPKDAQPIVFHHGWPLSLRRLGRADAVLPREGLSASSPTTDAAMAAPRRSATATTWTTTPPTPRPWPSISTCSNAVHIGHSTGGGEVARYVAKYRPAAGPRRQGGAGQRRSAADAEDREQSRRHADRGVRRLPHGARRQPRAVLSSMSPSGPFYGFNRPGAKVSQGVIENWWRQGMMGGAKAHYDGIKAFSETDQTDDLKAITVPTLVLHGDDDQVVPYDDAALLSVKLLKNGTLKIYPGYPHGMLTTHADVINPDLLAFIKG